ncbi:MAG: calcium/sodium antiporter [Salinibacter sp.]
MLLYALLFLVGIGLLYVGAERLVEGASGLALHYGIPARTVGVTVVALGTSMPEFLVNFFAVFAHESSLALGNIVGSNISNVALILGSSALILPLTVTTGILRREYPIMLGVMVLFYVCALDGTIGTGDGVIMVLLLIGLASYLFYDTRRAAPVPIVDELEEDVQTADGTSPPWAEGLSLIGGSLALGVGAHLMVRSATWMAHQLGVPSMIIGLSIVAIGTSLPELAASVVSAYRAKGDLSVGNVMGSNLLNVLFVVGVISLFTPLDVEPRALRIDFPIMLAFCALLGLLAWHNARLSRAGGGLLLAGFVGYMMYLLVPYL